MKVSQKHKAELLDLLDDLEEQVQEASHSLLEPNAILDRETHLQIATVMLMELVLVNEFKSWLYFLKPGMPIVLVDEVSDDDLPF